MPGLFSTRTRNQYATQPQQQNSQNPPVPGASLRQRYQLPPATPSPFTPGQRIGMDDPNFMRVPGGPSRPQFRVPGNPPAGFDSGMFSVKDDPFTPGSGGLFGSAPQVSRFDDPGYQQHAATEDAGQNYADSFFRRRMGGNASQDLPAPQEDEVQKLMQQARGIPPDPNGDNFQMFRSNDQLAGRNLQAERGRVGLNPNQGYSPQALDQNANAVHSIMNTRPDAQAGGLASHMIAANNRFRDAGNQIGSQPNGTPMFQDPSEFDALGHRHIENGNEQARRQAVIDRMHRLAAKGLNYSTEDPVQSIGPTGDLASKLSANNARRASEFAQRSAAFRERRAQQQGPGGNPLADAQIAIRMAGPRQPDEGPSDYQNRVMQIHQMNLQQRQQGLAQQMAQKSADATIKNQPAGIISQATADNLPSVLQALGQQSGPMPQSAPLDSSQVQNHLDRMATMTPEQAKNHARQVGITPAHLNDFIQSQQPWSFGPFSSSGQTNPQTGGQANPNALNWLSWRLFGEPVNQAKNRTSRMKIAQQLLGQ